VRIDALLKDNKEDLCRSGTLEECGLDIEVNCRSEVAVRLWYCRILNDRVAVPEDETKEVLNLLLARRHRAHM
jgi:hypothetical protein